MAGKQARTVRVLRGTAEQRATVEALLRRRDLTPRVRERLEMVKAVALAKISR